MRKRVQNGLKRYCFIVCMVIVAVLVVKNISFAAYTNFNSVKRVISTTKTDDTRFSSNYLLLIDMETKEYPLRRISPAEIPDNDVTYYSFTVQICNYVFGNMVLYNNADINYAFTVKVMTKDNSGTLPYGVEGITVNNTSIGSSGEMTKEDNILTGGSATSHSYRIIVPETLKDVVNIEISATPKAGSYTAVDNQKLAAKISLSTFTPSENWTGKFIDNQSINVCDYDGFNYEISGNGKGTITLKWTDNLQLSPWFVNDVNATKKDEKEYSFAVGTTESSPTAYQLQFYKEANNLLQSTTWEALSSSITVTFTPEASE